MKLMEKIAQSVQYIESITKINPTIGLVLGSGLGDLADLIEEKIVIKYQDIPHFGVSHAIGHASELVIGKLSGQTVVAMKGRFHYYEGYSLEQVTIPIRVMKALGVQKLIITNACGAVNENFRPGELMLITDHINLVADNPLIGPNDDTLGPRFPDLTDIYSKRLRAIAKDVAKTQDLSLYEGVYAWWSGPSYETKAEIKMIRILGADAVGMSTVPEAIVAAHAGVETLGISCLTNMAAGILDQKLSHAEVIEVAAKVKTKFITFVKAIIHQI